MKHGEYLALALKDIINTNNSDPRARHHTIR
jgi:hypothetical protein